MTKATKDGNVARRVALDVQDTCLKNAKLLKIALDDLTDGDDDTRRAQQAFGELFVSNMEVFAVQVKVADHDYAAAETMSMRMAAQDKDALQ